VRLELARLRAAPGRRFHAAGEEEIPSLDWWGETLSLEGPVQVTASAFYQGERVFLTLRVSGRIHRRCSRCLAGLVEHFSRKDFLEVAAEGVYLELRPFIESQVRLAISPRPLCRPDCRGLCPDCGVDLNFEAHRPGCGAQARSPDPRLAKLRELL